MSCSCRVMTCEVCQYSRTRYGIIREAGAKELLENRLVKELVESLKHTWPGEYGKTVNKFNKEALKEFGVE